MKNVLSFSPVCIFSFQDGHVQHYIKTPGADIQFRRPHRLDVCVVQNHDIAL